MKESRFWEIDFLRGIAVIMMIAYHIIFDINYLKIIDIDIYNPAVWVFARSIPVIFILLVGLSLSISYERKKEILKGKKLYWKYIKRGLWIFSWGIAITIVSWFFVPESFIIFGILHFIGLSIILAIPFMNKRINFIMLGGIVIAIGTLLLQKVYDFSYLLWLGFPPVGFSTLDYFPILPWFGFVLIGMQFGKDLYLGGKRNFRIKERGNYPAIRQIRYLGRHSLVIYLAHQVIILGALFIILNIM